MLLAGMAMIKMILLMTDAFARERPRGVGRSWEGVLTAVGKVHCAYRTRGIYTESLGFPSLASSSSNQPPPLSQKSICSPGDHKSFSFGFPCFFLSRHLLIHLPCSLTGTNLPPWSQEEWQQSLMTVTPPKRHISLVEHYGIFPLSPRPNYQCPGSLMLASRGLLPSAISSALCAIRARSMAVLFLRITNSPAKSKASAFYCGL